MRTEKEKMLNGEMYDATDETLYKERETVKNLTYDYNLIRRSDKDKRDKIIREILGKAGKNLWIESPFQCDYGYNTEIGDNFYSNHNLIILDCAKVKIGNNVFVGPNTGIYTACHPIDAKERMTFLEWAEPITIGNDVWLGGNVTILPGVTIGDNVVIGAGSVVTKDIPSNCVAVGNPCKPIKKLN